ncbi:MAG: rRNA maturation RNase YbeY [Gemmatimonadaceae bacterium]|nr:rRNA maturation RNase YbeY [Gemmatimonadaceae bacterium]NUQ92025.1 rRNA maturation RNase YbeY [Gemmatimonadaceae bacterium]NUR19131.1 rRNA maturation RNase YbeY [Gemmatimonadaceae bacterium]NUS98227.1 rRNA maturation RNase YbeY [Gemmatimonadaceae bacterium]
MSLDVEVAADGVRVPLSRERVAELARAALRAEGVRDATLSIAFVPAAAIARINARHLGHRGPTDVISFPIAAVAGGPRGGDIYIAPEVARTNARRHGAGVREEIARLVVHAVLHVLGHDHPEGEARTTSPMWRRQEALLRRHQGAWRA